MKQIIFIEGSISAGKSHIIEQLKELNKTVFPDIKILFIPEPLEIWGKYKDESGKSILQLFYGSQKEYSLKLQLILLKSLMD